MGQPWLVALSICNYPSQPLYPSPDGSMLRDILLEEMKLNPLVGGLSQAKALHTMEKLIGEIVPMV